MDTEQIKTFLEVSRTRHFGRAAQNLFLSQSAVSARIHALEEQLGTPLFVRTRNDIQLTAAGSRLLSHAENILAAWNRAKQDVAIEEDSTASLAVAGTPSLWDIRLQGWLHTLHRTHPGIAIQAEALEAELILRRLMEGTLDLGFGFEPAKVGHIEATQVGSIPLLMVSTRAGITTAEALARDYVLVDWGVSFSIEHSRHFPDCGAPAIRLNLGRIALHYLMECGGSAYLAQPMVAQACASGQLFKVEGAPVIERPAYALFSPRSERAQLVAEALALFTAAPA